MSKFIKFNIVFGVLAILSALGNIYVGTMTPSSNIYTNNDLIAAITQVILATTIVLTGFIVLRNKLRNSGLKKSHVYF